MKLFLRILGFLMIFFLIIALVLALAGFDHIEFDSTYYKLLLEVNNNYQGWQIAIPSIPKIETLTTGAWYELILNAFINFVNGFFTFLNVIIMILNLAIQIIQFVSTFLYTIIIRFPEIVQGNGYTPVLNNSVNYSL